MPLKIRRPPRNTWERILGRLSRMNPERSNESGDRDRHGSQHSLPGGNIWPRGNEEVGPTDPQVYNGKPPAEDDPFLRLHVFTPSISNSIQQIFDEIQREESSDRSSVTTARLRADAQSSTSSTSGKWRLGEDSTTDAPTTARASRKQQQPDTGAVNVGKGDSQHSPKICGLRKPSTDTANQGRKDNRPTAISTGSLHGVRDSRALLLYNQPPLYSVEAHPLHRQGVYGHLYPLQSLL